MSLQRLHTVYDRFLDSQNQSAVAHAVIRLLSDTEQNGRYIIDSRNKIVRNLADDVAATGISTGLMFRTSGYPHDCLHILLDEYLNYMDSIYYPSAPLPDFTDISAKYSVADATSA